MPKNPFFPILIKIEYDGSMFRSFVLLSLIFFSSLGCSHFSKNQVKRSSLTLSGGRFLHGSWNDALKFKRISWYREWALVFDLFYARLKEDSPFHAWISQAEKSFLDKCQDYYIVMTYHPSSSVISESFFLERASRFGYERIFLNEFDKQLRMHPSMTFFSLSLYNIHALCRSKGEAGAVMALDLPGYNRVEL